MWTAFFHSHTSSESFFLPFWWDLKKPWGERGECHLQRTDFLYSSYRTTTKKDCMWWIWRNLGPWTFLYHRPSIEVGIYSLISKSHTTLALLKFESTLHRLRAGSSHNLVYCPPVVSSVQYFSISSEITNHSFCVLYCILYALHFHPPQKPNILSLNIFQYPKFLASAKKAWYLTLAVGTRVVHPGHLSSYWDQNAFTRNHNK